MFNDLFSESNSLQGSNPGDGAVCLQQGNLLSGVILTGVILTGVIPSGAVLQAERGISRGSPLLPVRQAAPLPSSWSRGLIQRSSDIVLEDV